MPRGDHTMRAKLTVSSVEVFPGGQMERVTFRAVTGTEPYGPDGASEDNTYARYTPDAEASFTINNPNLLGKLKPGKTYYADFIEADDV